MKYLPLLWAALWRRKPRTIFTMLSIGVAFLLFGMLQAFTAAFNVGVELAGADRLVTVSKYSFTQLLPYGFYQQIKATPGVKEVTFATWFGGIYQDEKNFFPQFAVEAESYLSLYPEIELPPEQKSAFLATRTGAVIARRLAERYGFKIGDRIPIRATIWPSKAGDTWTFDLVGIFDNPDPAVRGQIEMMLFHDDYFEEARLYGQGRVGWYVIRTTDADNNAVVSRAIDERFRNSPDPTKTDSERAFNQSFIKQIGDIGLIVTSILGAVFFTLLLLTGNTMMQSVRERIPELAVLKTLGYSDMTVLWLVLAESLALCLLAAAIGLAASGVVLPGIAAKLQGFSGLELRPSIVTKGLTVAALLALVVGAIPALQAKRLNIVNALAGH